MLGWSHRKAGLSMARHHSISFAAFHKMFPDEDACRDYLFQKRWPNGFVCPKCGGFGCYTLRNRKEYVCKQCHKQSSVTTGTVMHRSHLPLTVWFWAMFLVSRDKRGYSAKRLSADLDISYHSAWYLLHRIRKAMAERDSVYQLIGTIEMDETFYGAPGARKHGRGTGKTSILVALSKDTQGRPGFLKMKVAPVTKQAIGGMVNESVTPGSIVQTDGLNLYQYALSDEYQHDPHPNGTDPSMLNWTHTVISNAKAFLHGTFHGLDKRHLQRYLDEYCYRFNRRFYPEELFPHLCSAVMQSHILGLVELK